MTCCSGAAARCPLGTLLAGTLACSGEPTAVSEGGVREQWYQAQPGDARAQPAVAGGLVYFGTGDGQVIARDVGTGSPRWAAKVGGDRVEGANILARGGVVAVSMVRHTVALDAVTGRELWRYEAPRDSGLGASGLPGQVVASRLDADDQTVYIPAWGASVSAVDLRTGAVRWVWQPGRALTDTAANGSLFRSGSMGVRVSGDTVFATAWHFLVPNGALSEAWLLALDRATGRELWRVILPPLRQGVAVEGAPAVASSLVIATVIGGATYAVDRATQQIAWRFEVPGRTQATGSQPELRGDVVYVDGGDRQISALRAADGILLWRSAFPSQTLVDLLATERRIVFSEGATLYVIDRQTGRRVAAVAQPRTADPLFASAAAYADGRLFVTVNGAAWSFDEP